MCRYVRRKGKFNEGNEWHKGGKDRQTKKGDDDKIKAKEERDDE